MGQQLRGLPISLASLMLLSACGTTTTSFSLPRAPATTVMEDASLAGAIQVASHYASAYETAANGLADGAQWFDLPLLAAGGAGAGALAFGAHPDVALAAALGAGLVALASDYYAPRKRTLIYAAGSEAMACIAREGNRLRGAEPASSARSLSTSGSGSPLAPGSGSQTVNEPHRPASAAPNNYSRAAAKLTAHAATLRSTAARPAAGAASKVGPVATSAPAATASAQALQSLAAASDQAATVLDDLSAAQAAAPDQIRDAVRQVNIAVLTRVQSSSVAPTFASGTAAIKASQEAAYKLANEVGTARDRFRQSKAVADAQAPSAGDKQEREQAAQTIEEELSVQSELLAKLPPALTACVSQATP